MRLKAISTPNYFAYANELASTNTTLVSVGLGIFRIEAGLNRRGTRSAELQLYQSTFKANCTCREVVEVLVMAPAVPETPLGVNTIRLGVLKFARLSKLNSSALNSTVMRSRICVSLKVEKSHDPNPGPLRVSLPRFPQNPLFGGGARKALGLNHCLGEPMMAEPWKSGFTNGLTGFFVSPSFDGL